MALGGWWRLWIVLSGLYALLVAGFTWNYWPVVENMPDKPEYERRLSKESQERLGRRKDFTILQLEALQDASIRAGDTDNARY